MAVYSMTGYASAAHEAGENSVEKAASVTVEARSVNGRFLDLALRLPDELRGLEPALRELLTSAFRRGKIELRVATSGEAENQLPRPTTEQLQGLRQQQTAVHAVLPQARVLSVNEVLHWCKGGATAVRLDEGTLAAARRCVEGLKEARAREGDRLAGILMERVGRLRELAAQAAPVLPVVVQRQQARFIERWNEALATVQ
ncbi:MAG TPA: YicC/YloC family endoribonuclease, partial [Rubrivivax sp.]|nr:YicC/YloC family endoribonuclease [Rubrivivax sp.]